MIRVEWRRRALDDLLAIVDFIALDNPVAALALQQEIEEKVVGLARHPKLYRPGRVPHTREMVVRPSYIVVYAETQQVVSILRVLHSAQQWP